jgi:hypothetical protein
VERGWTARLTERHHNCVTDRDTVVFETDLGGVAWTAAVNGWGCGTIGAGGETRLPAALPELSMASKTLLSYSAGRSSHLR